MQNNKQKHIIQMKALDAWVPNKCGTQEIITGVGKTFIALHALYTMPMDTSVIHLFLAETNARNIDLIADISKFNQIFKCNVLMDYNLRFVCYQTARNWKGKKFGLIICDEIHDSLTPAYVKFYMNNHYDAIIGLSATISREISYTNKRGEMYTKGEMLDAIAPVIFTYNMAEGQRDGTARNLIVYIIRHKLDRKTKNVKAGGAKNPFMQTEGDAYDYWDKQHQESWFIDDYEKRDKMIAITARKRSKILYNLKSKIGVVGLLLKHIRGKTILFGNSIDSLLEVTPNVISSRNSEEKNNKIRHDFDTGLTNLIGSFKKLKQGANLEGLDNCIMMSYFQSQKDFIQRAGRLRVKGEIGNVFMILTMDTQEEVWFKGVFENMTNLNMVFCDNVDECIKKLKENLKKEN